MIQSKKEGRSVVLRKNFYRTIRIGMEFFNKIVEDHVSAYSAMTAYFMLMSIFPLLILLLLLAKYLPFTVDDLLRVLNNISMIQENSFIQNMITEAFLHSNTTVMGLTIITLIWAASKGTWAIIQGMNSVYDIEETRNPLLLRIAAMFYTVAFTLIIALSLVLLVFSSSIYNYVLIHYTKVAPFAGLLVKFKSFFSLFVLTGFFLLVYRFLPARKSNFRGELIGAVFASLGWSFFSFGFSIYMSRFSNYTHIYGGLGTVLMFLLWFYMIMYILFLGAEINFLLSDRGRYRIRTKLF